MTTPLPSLHRCRRRRRRDPRRRTPTRTSMGSRRSRTRPNSPETIRAVVGAGRGAVSADDAEEHARCRRRRRRADSNETGMYQDMFDKQVALTLSKRQDLGIARLFERQLGGQDARRRPGRGGGSTQARRRPAARPRSPRRRAARGRGDPAADAVTPQQAAEFVSAGAADHSPRGGRARRQSARACWRRRRSRPAGASACRAPRTAPRASTVRRQGGRGVERRARRRGYRGVQRRRRDAAAHGVSCLRLHRGERQRFRQPARQTRRAIARRSPPAAMRRPTSRHRQIRLRHRPGVWE